MPKTYIFHTFIDMARKGIQAYPSGKLQRLIEAYAADEERKVSAVCVQMFYHFFETHPELKRRCESLIEKNKS